MFLNLKLKFQIHDSKVVSVHLTALKGNTSAISVVNLTNRIQINKLAVDRIVMWPICRTNKVQTYSKDRFHMQNKTLYYHSRNVGMSVR